ncbi:glycosyltransferase, partial [Mammaliicoccus fleurettii]
MNILHINCNYLHTPLYSEMISRLNVFHENTIVMPRKIHETYPISENVKYGTEFLINDKIFNKSDRFLYFKKQKKIKKWLNSNSVDFNNFDIIHAHTLFSDGYWAYKSGKPYIITVRNTDLNYFMKYYKHLRHIGKKILRNSSKIIFLSKMYEERTINELFKSKERQSIFNKSVVIPNGINDFWIKNSLTKQHNEEPKTN